MNYKREKRISCFFLSRKQITQVAQPKTCDLRDNFAFKANMHKELLGVDMHKQNKLNSKKI
jgi:hypothetical protein